MATRSVLSLLGHSDLIVAILCDISHPWQCLITGLLNDLEVADLNSRYCKRKSKQSHVSALSRTFTVSG
jgi:hypothetical protein